MPHNPENQSPIHPAVEILEKRRKLMTDQIESTLADHSKRLTIIEHLTRGVDGLHGMARELTVLAENVDHRFIAIEKNMIENETKTNGRVDKVEEKLQVVTLTQTKQLGALIIIGFLAEMFIAHLWK